MINKSSFFMIALLLISSLSVTSQIRLAKANGTIYIRADGSIDPSDAPIQRDGDTYTQNADITTNTNGIVIERDNMTWNGQGYALQGASSGNGIDLTGRKNVTITNVKIKNFVFGILSRDGESSSENTIIGNNITHNVDGIELYSSANYCIVGNNITDGVGLDADGIYLRYCSNNSIIGNEIIANDDDGIVLHSSSNNTILNNSIRSHDDEGIYLYLSINNTISGNLIANNFEGMFFDSSPHNKIYHNNVFSNTHQVSKPYSTDVSVWDDGYPSGGNYWSDYVGIDDCLGPNQDEPGSDGVGDTPYTIDPNNIDHYPLMNIWVSPDVAVLNITSSKTIVGEGYAVNMTLFVENQGSKIEDLHAWVYANETEIEFQTFLLRNGDSLRFEFEWDTVGFAKGYYNISVQVKPIEGETETEDNSYTVWLIVSLPGDLNGDFSVSLSDLVLLAKAYGSKPRDPNWNANADIDNNAVVGLTDLVILANHYGQHYP